MKRHNAQKSIPVARVALVSLLLAVLWPADPGGGEASTGAPIGRFVIGVYKPAGWSGGGKDGGASPHYDRFFTAADARNLNDLGVNLTISTPYVTGLTNTSAPDTTQKLEAEILKRFGPYGGYVVEQPSEGAPHDASGNPWPSGRRLLDFAGDPSYLGGLDSVAFRNRLGAQVDSLAAKWTLPDSGWADGFFGYFIGHESDPKGAGGIYDSATYPHLKTVIDSIRAHDTERAIVVVGNAGDTGKWTPGEQTAFRQAFFRRSTDSRPANILMNEQYILSCGSNTDAKVRDRIDRALLPSLNRARDLIGAARGEDRKAEWYHIVNVNNEYKSGSPCWNQCADGRRQPHYRQPSRAELKAQAHLALARGATGIVYFAYTSKPDTSALACGSTLPLAANWYHGLRRFASPGSERAKYAMYDTVKAVNDTLARIGAALYPEVSLGEYRPLTWDDNYDNFSSDRLSSSTLIDSARASADSSSAGRLEFGQFHDGAADYVLAVNRDSLASGGAQTIDLRFDPARRKSGQPVSRVYAVTETATGFGDTLVADAAGHVWVSGQRLAPGDGRLYRLRGQAGLWAGPVQGRVAWQDTVRVSGDVTVTAGATLTLARGTTVLFSSRRDDTGGGADPTRSELIVESGGSLVAKAGGIVFGSADADTAGWYGLRVLKGGSANLTNAALRDGVKCMQGTGTLTLSNTRFSDCGLLSGADSVSYVENGTASLGTYRAALLEGVSFSWTLSGVDGSAFQVVRSGPVPLQGLAPAGPQVKLGFKSAPDFERPTDQGKDNTYRVRVQATGLKKSSGSGEAIGQVAPMAHLARDVTVTVTDGDDPGRVSLSTTAPRVGRELKAVLADDDGVENLSWGWFSLSSQKGASASAAGTTPGEGKTTPGSHMLGRRLWAQATYDDGHGTGKQADSDTTAALTAGPPSAPSLTAQAGDRMVALSWTAADSNGSWVTGYSLRDSAAGSWSDWTAVRGQGAARDSTLTGLTNGRQYPFEVRAKNAVGDGDSSRVWATSARPRIAGPDSVWYAENGTDTVAVYRVIPSGGSWTWSRAGADRSAFTGGDTLRFARVPDYEKPVDADSNNVYQVQMRATPSARGFSPLSKTVAVTVTNVNEPGAISLSPPRPKVNEQITATLSDPDTVVSVTKWRWMFYIQGGVGFGGTSQAEAEAAAVETAGGFSSTYTPGLFSRYLPLEVIAFYTDALASGQQVRVVTAPVGAPNRAPTLSGVSDTTFAENDTAAVAAYTGADADGDSLTWSLAGTDASAFRWQGTGLRRWLRFAAAPDFEAKSTYRVTARVRDGSASATQAVTVRVTDVDEAPVLSGAADTTFAENGTGTAATYRAVDPEGDAVTWSLTGADRDTLRLSSGGKLSFRSAPDYEAPADTGADNAYEVRVRAFDGPLGDSLAVTVRVTDVDEPGRVSLSSAAAQVDSPLTAALSDPDGGVTGAAWQWQRLASRSSAGVPIASATSSSYTPQAEDVENWLVAGASYRDAQGAGKSAGDTTAAWVVSVPSAPKDLKAAPGNGRVTLTWTAADSNGAWINEYSVCDSTKGGSWSGWSVVPGAGSARDTTRTGLTNDTTYFFQVRAGNRVGKGPAADTTATPKAPSIVLTLSGPDSVGFAENETDSVAAYRAQVGIGASGQSLVTWSLAGADREDFTLKGGILSFQSPPNYEAPADADADNGYRVRVKGSAGGSLSDSLTVKVTVTDVEEAGIVRLSSTAPKVNTTLSAALTDPDGGVNTKTWTWRWQRRATSSSPWTNVGAQARADSVYQGAPYRPVSDDAGYQLRATVGYTDARGSGKTAASAATGAVAAAAPSKPKNLKAAPGNGRVKLTWAAADSHGAWISDYSLRDSTKGGSWSGWSVVPGAGTARDTTRTGLTNDTTYFFQVRAGNRVGKGRAAAATARPKAPSIVLTLTGPDSVGFAEKGTGTVATYRAQVGIGASGQSLVTWSLAGADQGDFTLKGGILSFQTAPDFEAPADTGADNGYRVRVKGSAGGGLRDSLTVKVTVTDVNEPPGKPTLVSVSAPSTDGHSKLNASWTAPANSGKPPISGYTVRYCYTAFTSLEDPVGQSSCSDKSAGTGTSTTLTGLYANTLYRVKVKATNAEGTGPWSTERTAVTRRRPNRAPSITGPAAKSVAENTTSVASYTASDPDGDAITWTLLGTDKSTFSLSSSGALSFKAAPNYEAGKTSFSVKVKATDNGSPKKSATKTVSVTVTDVNEPPSITGPSSSQVKENATSVASYSASDPDGDAVTWTLEGTDKSTFSLSSSGALSFKTAPDYEAGKTGFSVKVKATDDGSPKKSATRTVAVTVTDVNEPPGKPTNVSVSAPSTDGHSKLNVTWTAPANTGKPPISGYTVRYCYTAFTSLEDPVGQSSCSDKSAGTGTSTTLTGLYANTLYRVKVKATNAEGTGPWSTERTAVTRRRPNRAPTISGPSSPKVKENTTAVASYTASDPDDDAITWTLLGTDKSTFTLSGSGALSFKTAPDYEAGTRSFSVKVQATDNGSPKKSATRTVAVTVTDADEPPGKPTSVSVAPNGYKTLGVRWTAPANSGKPALSSFTVQYCKTSLVSICDSYRTWSSKTVSSGAATQTTLSGLAAATSYTVQVRARNAEGSGPWSNRASGSTQIGAVAQEEAAKILAEAADLAVRVAPNPFNPGTTIYFRTPAPGRVSLVVYNLAGQAVARLLPGAVRPGGHGALYWDGRDEGGRPAAAGIYLYRLGFENQALIGKMTLLK